MSFQNKTNQKLISFLLVIAILGPTILFSRPNKAEAFPVVDWFVGTTTGITAGTTGVSAGAEVTQVGFAIKDLAKDILRQVLMTVAKRALQQMTKSTINWINTGFHGSPLFVENPKSFFRDIAKFEIKSLVDTFGYNSARFPFGKNFALNTINSYKSTLETNAQYTLSNVINDPALLERYRTDFNVGGWNGFLINTQYPQNNYIGFQMLATEELARRLEGTSQNAAQKVNTTLQQGMGFLSPQTCPSNPNYPLTTNPYNPPTFKPSEMITDAHCYDLSGEAQQQCLEDTHAAIMIRIEQDARAKAEFDGKYSCPGGLVNSTPGSVVGDQIRGALGSGRVQMELAGAMGNSISAVLDALLNKFLGDGLNKLASKINKTPEPDTWTYDGQSLGSPTDGTNNAWDSGPDEEIRLDDFKKRLDGETIVTNADGTTTSRIGNTVATTGGIYTPGDIANTETEIRLMYNESANDPGLMQMFSLIWPKTRELDICLPGPDLGWQKRVTDETVRNSKKLEEKSSEQDGEKAAAADLVLKELKYAVDSFKDWVNNKMLVALPGSVFYMDAIDGLETIYQQSDEVTSAKRTKTSALARLRAIKAELDNFIEQPSPGSGGEKVLINFKKQYNAIRLTASNAATIEDAKNELAIAREKLSKLNDFISDCKIERTAKGWSLPGGQDSKLNNQVKEREFFCEWPLKGGYDHESFTHANDKGARIAVTHPEIPYVNAYDVLKWRGKLGLIGHSASIDLDCKTGIYDATVTDYKKSIPGVTIGAPTGGGSPTQLGNCTYPDGFIQPNMTENNCTADGGTWTANGGITPTPTPTPTPNPGNFDFSLSSPAPISVVKGSSGSTFVTATLTAGATQKISFLASPDDLIPGLNGISWTNNNCNATCTARVTVFTTVNTSPGQYYFTVEATGGEQTHTVQFYMIVSN